MAGDSADLVKATLPYMSRPGTAQGLAGIGNAFGQMGYGRANALPTFQARTPQLLFAPQNSVADITSRALAGISPAAAQQIGNNFGDVDTSLPQVFTAPQADPSVAQALAKVPSVTAPQATNTAPTVPTPMSVGGKAPLLR